MSEYFGTDPNSPKSHLLSKEQNISWDHKERTIASLIDLGVPLRVAELATIDLRTILYTAQKNKLTPVQTARMMYDEVVRLYKRGNGRWRF